MRSVKISKQETQPPFRNSRKPYFDCHNLLRKFNEGDLTSFDELYKLKYPHLFRLVLWKANSRLDFLEAEGIVQQAFFQIFRKIATYRGQSDAEAWSWIWAITHHHMIDVIRQKDALEKDLVSLDDETCFSQAVFFDELAFYRKDWLVRFFVCLSHREKQTLSMIEIGMSQKEIAKKIGVSLPRVTQILKSIQAKALKFGK